MAKSNEAAQCEYNHFSSVERAVLWAIAARGAALTETVRQEVERSLGVAVGVGEVERAIAKLGEWGWLRPGPEGWRLGPSCTKAVRASTAWREGEKAPCVN